MVVRNDSFDSSWWAREKTYWKSSNYSVYELNQGSWRGECPFVQSQESITRQCRRKTTFVRAHTHTYRHTHTQAGYSKYLKILSITSGGKREIFLPECDSTWSKRNVGCRGLVYPKGTQHIHEKMKKKSRRFLSTNTWAMSVTNRLQDTLTFTFLPPPKNTTTTYYSH